MALREPPPQLDLDRLSADWQLALDAALDALDASDRAYPAGERERRRGLLREERQRTATVLRAVARADHVTPAPWLSPVRVGARMLGVPAGVRGCVFDLDGVLTDSGLAHATAWAEVLDDFLLRHTDLTGWHFIPFDRDADYRAYIDGRPRLEGLHAFLASRGIRLPEGRPGDEPSLDTAQGLARRKSEALERVLHRRGVTPLEGARRYLEAVAHAGLPRAVVSSSQSTRLMLELAGLSSLVEVTVDAAAIRAGSLRSRPAPDLLLAACEELGVEPARAVTFTHSAEGVAAGRAAGLVVVAVGDDVTLERLRGFGAERAVPSLAVLLDPLLAAA